MRELGIIVNDVHKRHVKGPMKTHGAQYLTFKDVTIVDLKCRLTLITFTTTVPTMEEIETLPNYQITFNNWNPQQYYDNLDVDNLNISDKNTEHENTKTKLFSAAQNITTDSNDMQ